MFVAFTLSSCTGSPVGSPVGSSVSAAGVRPVLQGRVFGGQQPITGATIQLYTVGTTTDGGASTPMLTTTVTTSDGTGEMNSNANAGNGNNQLGAGYFNITGDYTCPAGDELVYLTASGGNPGLPAGTLNAGIENMIALGSCENLETNVPFLVVNELTTVGAVAALYSYMTAYNAIGSTPGHAAALAAAFHAANEYSNLESGTAPGPALPVGYDADANDVRALANVVAACVNSAGGTYGDGTACGSLYVLAKPAGSTVTPADTVSALLDIRNNPTHNVGALFEMQGTNTPFLPVNLKAPVDWTLPILPIPGTPVFSPVGGGYGSAQMVTMSDADATAVMYYTTDGSVPTSSSPMYTGAIAVEVSETVQAIAVESGRLTSGVGSASYVIPQMAPVVSLSAVSSAAGSTGGVTITASEGGGDGAANGNVVSFAVTGAADGSFSPASCTMVSGSCSVSYVPSGALAQGTYAGDLTASFGSGGPYLAASATSTLTITGAPFSGGTSFNLLASFTGTGGTTPGMTPLHGRLVQGSDGNLYGLTYGGGASGYGTIFQVSPGGGSTLLHSFAGGTSDGEFPYGGLVQGSDGNFYGTTSGGGANGAGTVFEVTPGGQFGLVYSFTRGAGDANVPAAGLVQGEDGNFYGTTFYGGANGAGTVFEVTPAGAFTLLYSLNPDSDGANPYGTLVQGSDGNLYGTTYQGGGDGYGTVFEVTTSGAFTLLHTFAGAPADGRTAYTGLVEGSDGNFYGTTSGGGANDLGTVFEVTPTGGFRVIYSFSSAGTDGSTPVGGLVLGSDGSFYGTSYYGGPGVYGTIYRMTMGGSFSLLHSFSTAPTDGESPYAGVTQGSDGGFYGTTSVGGASGEGTVYRVASTPGLAGPVTLSVPLSVEHGTMFRLGYAVSNGYSGTLQTCVANNYLAGTSTVGDSAGWVGVKTGGPTVTNVSLTAPGVAGTYTYALTCGGMESGFATLVVQ